MEPILDLLIYFSLYLYTRETYSIINNNLTKDTNFCELVKSYNYIIAVFLLILVLLSFNIQKRKKSERKAIKLLKISQSMLDINRCILKNKNINQLFDLILEKTMDVIDTAKYGGIFVLNSNNLKIQSSKGYNKDNLFNLLIPINNSLHFIRAEGKINKILIINDVNKLNNNITSDYIKDVFKLLNVKSYLSAPILINNKLYGMINLYSDKKNAFNKTHIETVEYMKSEFEMAITNLKVYKKMYTLSKFDKLTNLYNLNYFEDEFNKYAAKCNILNKELNLVVFDLNELKKVNDTYGHDIGDLYIKNFANKLKSAINTSNILARYGGDEFVGLYLNKNSELLMKTFEDLNKYFKDNPIKVNNDEIFCSFSYGIATFKKDDISYSKLLKIADERMYNYKKELKSHKKNYIMLK